MLMAACQYVLTSFNAFTFYELSPKLLKKILTLNNSCGVVIFKDPYFRPRKELSGGGGRTAK